MRVLAAKAKEGRPQQLYLVKDTSKDFHTRFGYVSAAQLQKPAGRVQTQLGYNYCSFEPAFIDLWMRTERLPQRPLPKDFGAIIAHTCIGPDSDVVDAGGGSGWLACGLARIARHVTSYEIDPGRARMIERNAAFLGLRNLTVKIADIKAGIAERELAAITLDLPEPEAVLVHAKSALKLGGFVVAFSPQLTQALAFVNALESYDEFMHTQTLEIIERHWLLADRRARPTGSVLHSGWLSFARRIC